MKTVLCILTVATLLFAGEWYPDLYFRRMDKSTLSLREQAMGGAGYATGSGAGVLYTNAAQLVNMEGTEIRWSFEFGNSFDISDTFFSMKLQEVSYKMNRNSLIWSPSGKSSSNPGRFAFGAGFGNCTSTPIHKMVYDWTVDDTIKTGEYFTDGAIEIFLTTGYGHPLPTSRNNFKHSLGGVVDLGFHYIDSFSKPTYELAQKYLLGYHYSVERDKFGTFSFGLQTGMNVIPRFYKLSHFTYHLAGGWNRIIGSSDKWDPVGITLEVGINHDIYRRYFQMLCMT